MSYHRKSPNTGALRPSISNGKWDNVLFPGALPLASAGVGGYDWVEIYALIMFDISLHYFYDNYIRLIKQKQHIILKWHSTSSHFWAKATRNGLYKGHFYSLLQAWFFFGFPLMDGHRSHWEIEALSHIFIHLQGLLLVLEVFSDLSDLFWFLA